MSKPTSFESRLTSPLTLRTMIQQKTPICTKSSSSKRQDSPPPLFRKIWVQQCEAAEGIEADYGTEKALGYLIGEKLLNFLEVAERKPEWRAEVPLFIAKIKKIFEPWQIAEFLETPRRLGALGHTADEEGHKVLRSQVDESENLREDARNLMLFEQAREWLLEDKE